MLVKNLYDISSFQNMGGHKSFIDSVSEQKKTSSFTSFRDSAITGGIVLSRFLEEVDPIILTKKYPENTFLNSGITVDNSGNPYARTITSRRVTPTGGFTDSSDSTTDRGQIGISAEVSQINTNPLGAQSKWTEDDLKEAELSGINLLEQFLDNAQTIYTREVNRIGLLGIGAKEGLLNFSGYNTTASAALINTFTSEQQYNLFRDLINRQFNAVQNTEAYKANKVIMPVRVFNEIQKTVFNSAAGFPSVLMALQSNFPEIQFLPTDIEPTTPGGSSTVAYSTNRDSMAFRIPMPLRYSPIVTIGGWDYMIDYKYRIAGLDILETKSGEILRGL